MRLVHEYNRDKVERWLYKQRLQKIATLEEYDQHNLLSDRRMLADEYEYLGDFLMFDDPLRAEACFRKALEIILALHEHEANPNASTIDSLYSRIDYAQRLYHENQAKK